MRTPQANRDEGFTLIEVIIAISLLLTVAVALGAFMIQGLRLSTDQQRAQIAVSVATERMDQVQRLSTSNVQLPVLVAGRPEASVRAAWNHQAGAAGLDETYPAWSATPSGPAVIPVEETVTRSGTDYTSAVLIGTCYQPASGGACTRIPGSPDDPGADSPLASDRSRLVRALVIVTYPGSCGDTGICRYTTAGLFDTKGDLTWLTD